MNLRDLPSVDELARDERLSSHAPALVLGAARTVIEGAREEIRNGRTPLDLVEQVQAEIAVAQRPSLRRAINATGVIVHTNLGRAPLAPRALDRVVEIGGSYSNLEYDVLTGRRSSRHVHTERLLCRLTAAEAAIVVNNNAAALLLAVVALGEGREVLVSRGELVEIGDGFRISEVLESSGARLVEVGATNRTHPADYERAIGPGTGLFLRVHQSNFRMVGFAGQPSLEEVADVAHRHGLAVVEDLGSGTIVAVEGEPSVQDALRAGADLVCFSGDKLLGGPQAGVVVGRSDLVERLRRHPLQRALRVDKLSLAALEGTLSLYLDSSASTGLPVLRMMSEPVETVRSRAQRLSEQTGGEVRQSQALVGGGALPTTELASYACLIEEGLAEPLRAHEVPIVGVVREGRLWLDCRTLDDSEIDEVVAAVQTIRADG